MRGKKLKPAQKPETPLGFISRGNIDDPDAYAIVGRKDATFSYLRDAWVTGIFSPATRTVPGDIVHIRPHEGDCYIGRWFRAGRWDIVIVMDSPYYVHPMRRIQIKSMAPLVELRVTMPRAQSRRNWPWLREVPDTRTWEYLERSRRITARFKAEEVFPETRRPRVRGQVG